MKTFRLLATALFLFALGTVAPAQESSEFSALRAKAEKGNGVAQYNLGLAYAEGRGVPADHIEAYVWLALARENGARGRALDNLVSSFDKTTFEAAQQRLADRKGTQTVKMPSATITRTAPVAQAPVETPTVSAPESKPATPPAGTTTQPATSTVDSAALTLQLSSLATDKQQLSSEVAKAWKEIEGLKAELTEAKTQTGPDIMRLRQERDTLSAKLPELAAEIAVLRADRDRLQAQATQAGKEVHDAGAASQAAQESARISESRVGELVRNAEAAAAELARTKQALAALEQAPKPTADTAALDQKTRELQAATAELESTGKFSRELEASLTRTNEEKAALTQQLGAAQAELTRAKADLAEQSQKTGGQIQSLNVQLADLQQKLTEAPVSSTRLRELESSLAAATQQVQAGDADRRRLQQELAGLTDQLAAVSKPPAAPAYPDLSGHVQELETALTAASAKITAAEQSTAQLVSQVGSLEQQNARLTSERKAGEAANQRVTELTAELAALQQRATLWQSDLAAAQAQAGILAAERDAARTAQNELGSALTKLEQEKTRLAATEISSVETARQLTALNEKVAVAEKQAAGARQERDALSARLTDLTDNLATLQADRERMQKLLADTGKKLRDATTDAGRIKELETQLAGLQNSLSAAQNTAPAYPDLSGKVRELEAQVTAANQQADTVAKTAVAASQQSTADLNTANEQLAQLRTALAAKSSAPAYPDLSDKVRELESAAADSARQLAAAGTAQSELQQQLAEATAAMQKASKPKGDDVQLRHERDELSGRVTNLAGEIAQLRTDRERMQKLLADSGKQLRDSTADAARIKELETQTTGLQSTLTSLSSEASQAREQITALTKAKEETQAQVSSLQDSLAAKSVAPVYPDLSGKVSELETQVNSLQAALAAKSSAPAYPDLSGRVSELEAQLAALSSEASRAREEVAALTKAKEDAPKRGSTPTYPNFAGRVVELETALADTRRQLADTQTALLAAEQAKSVPVAAEANPTDLQKQLAETEDKLATALRGYAMLQKERDALQASTGQSNEALNTEKNSLTARVAALSTEVEQLKAGAQDRTSTAQAEVVRLNESLTALQRSTAQNTLDLAATRALLQQVQGANTVLANENYQLKTMLARSAGTPGPVRVAPVSAPAAAPAARTHVVVSGDSLSRISQRYYGTANRWQEIYNANRDRLGTEGVLRIGTELRIP